MLMLFTRVVVRERCFCEQQDIPPKETPPLMSCFGMLHSDYEGATHAQCHRVNAGSMEQRPMGDDCVLFREA